METLLEIGDDLRALLDLLDESGGEITPANEAWIEDFFREIGEAQEIKVDNYAALIGIYLGRASVRHAESERIRKHAQADENVAKRLKDRLKLYLEMTEQKKIETARYRVSIAANGGKLPVDVMCQPVDLPLQYQRTRIEPDMDKLREALEQGREIPGVALGVRGDHLRIS